MSQDLFVALCLVLAIGLLGTMFTPAFWRTAPPSAKLAVIGAFLMLAFALRLLH